MAEFMGMAKMANATLTSPGIGTFPVAKIPRKPIGNQHVIRRNRTENISKHKIKKEKNKKKIQQKKK